MVKTKKRSKRSRRKARRLKRRSQKKSNSSSSSSSNPFLSSSSSSSSPSPQHPPPSPPLLPLPHSSSLHQRPHTPPPPLLPLPYSSSLHKRPRTPSPLPLPIKYEPETRESSSLSSIDSNSPPIILQSNESSDSSPKIQSLQTSLSFCNKDFIRNEKFATYKSLTVFFHFTTKHYNFEHNYDDVMIIRIHTESNIKNQIRDALLLLTKSKKKQHILICSTSIIQNGNYHTPISSLREINEIDYEVLVLYNECLAEYGELNVIHSNITIFHCVIGDTINFPSINKNIPLLNTVYIKDSGIPAFNKIANFCSLRKFDMENLNELYVNKYDSRDNKYKLIPFFETNEKWWVPLYKYVLSYLKGYLYQTTGTCWIHCVVNLIVLSPLSHEVESLLDIKNAEKMTFSEIANAKKDKSVRQLLFASLKNLLIRHILPKKGDGDILLPIAARVKGMVLENDENYFQNIEYGNGIAPVHRSTSKIFQLFFNNKTMYHIFGKRSIDDLVLYILLKGYTYVPKYVMFCGVFKIAPKQIDMFDRVYDLLGSIIIVSQTHAVCGIIVEGDECIVDSNKLITIGTWSDCSNCSHNDKSDFFLSNCIYLLRNE